MESLDPFPSTYGMKQIIIQIIRLQFFHRLMVHLDGILTSIVLEIGHLCRNQELFAGITFQGRTGGSFRKPLAIDRRCIEIIHSVSDSIIHQLIHRILVYHISITVRRWFQRPAHTSIS